LHILQKALVGHLDKNDPIKTTTTTKKTQQHANRNDDNNNEVAIPNMTTVLVSGPSGTGKTALVRHFVSVQQHQILYGAGKFEQWEPNFGAASPYAVLLQALTGVVQQIVKEENDNDKQQSSNNKALSLLLDEYLTPSQRDCIQELIPNSIELWSSHKNSNNGNEAGDDSSEELSTSGRYGSSTDLFVSSKSFSLAKSEYKRNWHIDGGEQGGYHFAFQLSHVTLALRSFLSALAETDRPLVLFLDDIQWAGNKALTSISTLLMEVSSSSSSRASPTLSDTHNYKNLQPTSGRNTTNELMAPEMPSSNGNRQRRNLLFIGAVRSEDNDGKRLDWLANRLSSKATIRIHLKHLDYECTHQIVNSALKQESEDTRALANAVYRTTKGNPYFVLKYLVMLQRERLLLYSFVSYQWQWNLNLIQNEINGTDNVVHLLSRQVERLPRDVRAVLRLAACLGFYFDIVVLQEIVLREGLLPDDTTTTARDDLDWNSHTATSNKKLNTRKYKQHALSLRSKNGMHTSKYGRLMVSQYDPIMLKSEQKENAALCAAWVSNVLGRAEREGLIERASNKQYKFSHDRVQRCLYEITPPGKPLDLLHLRIGRLVRDTYLTNLDDNEEKDDSDDNAISQNAMLDFAVEQLNMSASYIRDAEERIGLIELNLEASDKAGQHLTFLGAAPFLRMAQSLVEDEDWEDRYDLCLEVFSAVAEVEHSCGNSARALHAVDIILAKARNFDHKIRAIFVKVNALGAQGRLSAAIKEGRDALEHLGEVLPSKLGSINASLDNHKTNKSLRKLSRNQLLNLPEMKDPSKMAAVQLLNSLSLFAWHAAEESLLTAIILHLMTITLKYGQTQWTPFTYATYAMLLGARGDTTLATEFGSLAMELLQRTKSLAALPRTHLIIYTFINHLQQPLFDSVEPLLNAHRVGIESGELEYGSLAVSSYASLYVFIGLPLSNFSSDMRTISEQLHYFQQNVALWNLFGLVVFRL
jgi:predicted ATPase